MVCCIQQQLVGETSRTWQPGYVGPVPIHPAAADRYEFLLVFIVKLIYIIVQYSSGRPSLSSM